jgi:uncharacterized protein YjbI with pentapeptide repeats
VNAMASQNYLDLLSSGKTLWNTWRQAYADVQALEPDLHEADLRGADLDGAILSKALFDEALVSRVDPSEADLEKFDRREAESTEVKA